MKNYIKTSASLSLMLSGVLSLSCENARQTRDVASLMMADAIASDDDDDDRGIGDLACLESQ